MKHIVKGAEPASFQTWKRKKLHSANWNDFSRTKAYNELKQCLINEQAMLCCYCEAAIKKNSDAHIEHFKPQKNSCPDEMFNIQNLFACCQHNDSCGHKKGSDYVNGLVSPLDVNCQSRFTYTGNGKIITSDENDTLAQRTINLLAMNCKRLKNQRQSIIRALDNDIALQIFNFHFYILTL